MKIGIIGLGRMGGNIARRLMRAGHETVVYDRAPEAVKELVADGAIGAGSLDDMQAKLDEPGDLLGDAARGRPDRQTIEALAGICAQGDIIIDGGNTFYKDDIRAPSIWRKRASIMSMSARRAACGGSSAAIA